MFKFKIVLSTFLIIFFAYFTKRNWNLFNEVYYLTKQEYFTKTFIESSSTISTHMEAAPFLWQDKLYLLVTAREESNGFKGLVIHDFDQNKIINNIQQGHGLASALTHAGKILVVSTSGWYKTGTSEIKLSILVSPEDKNPETNIIVSANPDQKFFNTSLTYDNENKVYLLAYEVSEPGRVDFSARFLSSNDLKTWQPIGSVFGSDIYAACPTIRKIKGYYYLWYLATGGNRHLVYQTKIARSKNLIDWEISPYPFLTPEGDEGTNASDFDYVVKGNITHFFYADGDQRTWANIRYGTMNQSLDSIVETYFEKNTKLNEKKINTKTPFQTIKNAFSNHIKI